MVILAGEKVFTLPAGIAHLRDTMKQKQVKASRKTGSTAAPSKEKKAGWVTVELDPATMAEVRRLAKTEGCTPDQLVSRLILKGWVKHEMPLMDAVARLVNKAKELEEATGLSAPEILRMVTEWTPAAVRGSVERAHENLNRRGA